MKKKPEIFTEEEYESHKVLKKLANISSDSVINLSETAEAVEVAADAIAQLLSKVDKLESKKAK